MINLKAGKYLKFSEKGKLQAEPLLACLPARLPDTDKEIFRVSLLKNALLFLTTQAAILLMWYCRLFFQ